VPTLEMLADDRYPAPDHAEMKFGFINVLDLMTLQPQGGAPARLVQQTSQCPRIVPPLASPT